MKILRIACGICVWFTALAYTHLLHHHLMNSWAEDGHTAAFWAIFLLAAAGGAFAFVGGGLLLFKRD